MVLPYVNALGGGRPPYTLMSDSNIDWNQALPEVKLFAERHKLEDLAIDTFGFSDDANFIPKSHPWDCQAAADSDADQWVVVSANMILATANCEWLTRYPKEELAGGGMYAFHLPPKIPAAGTPGDPPQLADRRRSLGQPFDIKALALQASRLPETIPDLVNTAQKAVSGAH